MRPYAAEGEVQETSDLRVAYLRFLAEAEHQRPAPGGQAPALVRPDDHRGADLARRFGVRAVPDEQRAAGAVDMVSAGIDQLRSIEPELAALLALTTTEVLCAADEQQIQSGTLPNRLGAMLINPRPGWDVGDVAEALLHESTHTFADLDDRRWGHYLDPALLHDRASWTRTGVLGRIQPFPFAFHSILVAAEILALRARLAAHGACATLHGETGALRAGVRTAIVAMREHQLFERIATARLRQLLDAAEASIAAVPSPQAAP